MNLYTKYTPEFSSFILPIACAKGFEIFGECLSPKQIIELNEDGHIEFWDFNMGKETNTPQDKFLTQGEFLDALNAHALAEKEKTLDCKIAGYKPKIKGGVVSIGCKKFKVEDLKAFAAEYKIWEESAPEYVSEPFYTESSTELRTYVKTICPKEICKIDNEEKYYQYLKYDNSSVSALGYCVCGMNDKPIGEQLTLGQFIDRVLNLKPVRKPRQTALAINGDLTNVTIGADGVDVSGQGAIKHEEVKAFLAAIQ